MKHLSCIALILCVLPSLGNTTAPAIVKLITKTAIDVGNNIADSKIKEADAKSPHDDASGEKSPPAESNPTDNSKSSLNNFCSSKFYSLENNPLCKEFEKEYSHSSSSSAECRTEVNSHICNPGYICHPETSICQKCSPTAKAAKSVLGLGPQIKKGWPELGEWWEKAQKNFCKHPPQQGSQDAGLCGTFFTDPELKKCEAFRTNIKDTLKTAFKNCSSQLPDLWCSDKSENKVKSDTSCTSTDIKLLKEVKWAGSVLKDWALTNFPKKYNQLWTDIGESMCKSLKQPVESSQDPSSAPKTANLNGSPANRPSDLQKPRIEDSDHLSRDRSSNSPSPKEAKK